MNTTKEQKLKALQDQLVALQNEIEELQNPDHIFVFVTNAEDFNWYQKGVCL